MHPYLRFHVQAQPELPRRLHRRPAVRSSELTTPRLRRVLGKALIDTFCPFGAPRCQQGSARRSPTELCHLAETCPYGLLYAASGSQRPPFALFIEPCAAAGAAQRTVELSLYGPAWKAYPWFLTALQRAFAMGFGRARQSWRIDRIFTISAGGKRHQVCSAELSELPADLSPEMLSLTTDRYLPSEPLRVELMSPTRLIRDGRLLPRDQPVAFELLIARIFDRFRGLYGDQSSELLRPSVRTEIEDAASRVSLLRDETRWVEVRDYSARNRSEFQLGGRQGRLLYAEPAARFLPLLQAGEVLHLGKNPTSGCGRIRVQEVRRAA